MTRFVLAVLLFSAPGLAQSEVGERAWGLGTVLGGGYAAGSASAGGRLASGGGLAVLLPTLEMRFFTVRGFSVDVTVPILNIIVTSALSRAFFWNTDAFFNFNVGDRWVRLLAGPGIGFSVAAAPGFAMGAVRIPGELGVELLFLRGRFGLQLMARPWVEFGGGSGPGFSASTIGGGVVGVVGLMGYSLKSAPRTD